MLPIVDIQNPLKALALTQKPLITATSAISATAAFEPGQKFQATVQAQLAPGIFKVHVADGRSVNVPHPDFLAISGNGRLAVVTSPGNGSPSYFVIDVPMITQLEVEGSPTNGASKS